MNSPANDSDATTATTERASGIAGRDRSAVSLGVIITILMVAPAVAAVLGLAGRHWWPTNDYAIIDLRVRDVFTANTPLTGLYSRPGWNHPGPLMFWGLAPLSWVTGHAPWATRIGGAVLQGAALVWLGIVTARHGGRLLLAAGVVTAMTYLASNQWLFREPWNLHIPLPYFVLFLFLTHLVAVGRFRHLIGMSVAATVMVSTHLGYAPLVVAGFAYALGWTLFDARGRRPPERWRNTLLISIAIWLLTWSAPLLDVVVHWPGNLGKVGTYFVSSRHRSLGFSAATRIIADEFRWVPPWLGGAHRLSLLGFAVPASVVWLAIPLGALGAGAIAIRRSRDGEDLRLVGLAGLMVVVGVLAISRADTDALAYTFQWRATVAAFLAVACGFSIAATLRTRCVRWMRVSAVCAVVGVVAVGSTTMTVAVVRRSGSLTIRDTDLRAVMRVVDHRPHPHGTVRVRAVGSNLPGLYDGVVNELARRNVDVRVDPGAGRIFGGRRTLASNAAAETWYVTEQGSLLPGLLARRGAQLLVTTSPLTHAEDTELATLQEAIGRALDRAGIPERRAFLDSSLAGYHLSGLSGIDPVQIFRLGQLNAKVERRNRCRCGVVVVPA